MAAYGRFVAGDPDDVNDKIWRPDYRGPAPLALPIRLSPATEPRPEGPPFHERRSSDPAGWRTAPETDSAPDLFESDPESGVGSPHGRRPSRRTVVGIVAIVAISIAGGVMVAGSGEEPATADGA